MKTEKSENRMLATAKLHSFGSLQLGRRVLSKGGWLWGNVLGCVARENSNWLRLMQPRKSVLWVAVVVASGMATPSLQAALTWNYFAQGPTVTLREEIPPNTVLSSAGESSLAVTFTTDGTEADLEGNSGTVSFDILEIVSVGLNIEGTNVDLLSGPVQESDPSSYLSSTDSFVWDLETGSVQSGGLVVSTPKFTQYGPWSVPVRIYFGESGLDQGANGAILGEELVRYSFSPTTAYSFAPVPEPGEWGLIFGLGAVVLVAIRRRVVGHAC